MTDEEMERVASLVAAKVLEEVSPPVLHSGADGLLIHFTEHAMTGSALIVDEAKAKRSPCNCFSYKGRDYCFVRGAIGILKPEQAEELCQAGKVYKVKPGMKERFEKFAEAAEVVQKEIEGVPEGERLIPWWRGMGREMSSRGIEV